jgi:hypothetical protein
MVGLLLQDPDHPPHAFLARISGILTSLTETEKAGKTEPRDRG